ncbi:MAG: DNA-binding protein [Candidatus Micrarchaeota archaeon]|nr:MAG: DNA-binding protein [Candidatus Micrarchaeota archaeon]
MNNEDNDEELQKKLNEQLERIQRERQIKAILRQIMDINAYDRLSNIAIANPELYSKVVNLILQLYQAGRITSKITEQYLLRLLSQLTFKPEPKIEFKRK